MEAILSSVSVLSYLVLLSQYRTSASKGAKDLTEALSENNSLQFLNARAIIVLPLMILSIALYSSTNQHGFLKFPWNRNSNLLIGISILFCLFLSVYSAQHFHAPKILVVSLKQTVVYFCVRTLGLAAYEIFFRGVLFGVALQYVSIPLAIGSNLALYALAHIFGSRKELIGCIPFGLILCYITILSKSIYPAVLLHLFLALPYESILLSKCQLLTKNSEI